MKHWIVDAHAHLDDERFVDDLDTLVSAFAKDGVLAVINPGCDRETSLRAMELAKQYSPVFACVGTHPHEAKYYNAALEKEYEAWLRRDKVVALGEIGLDYHYDFSERKVQREVFERQLQLAKDSGCPVVIHTREAIQDTYDIMKNFGSSIRAVMHSFSESEEMAEKFLNFGYYISLGGIVTFKNAKKPPALAAMVPEDRLLLETDSPYLAPVPKRGKRNEPSYAWYTLQRMAELRGVSVDSLADITTKNAARIYGLESAFEELRNALA